MKKFVLCSLAFCLFSTGTAWAQMGIQKQFNTYKEKSMAGDLEAKAMLIYLVMEHPEKLENELFFAISQGELAASGGNVVAQYNLGSIYTNVFQSIKKDRNKAIYWLSKASDNGYHAASVLLGINLLREHAATSKDGQFDTEFYNRVKTLLEFSVQEQHPYGLLALGGLLFYVGNEREEAKEHIKMAIALGAKEGEKILKKMQRVDK